MVVNTKERIVHQQFDCAGYSQALDKSERCSAESISYTADISCPIA